MDRRRGGLRGEGSISLPKRRVISRREFLELGLAAGATALMAGSAYPASVSAVPKRGGVLRVAAPSAARRLDPTIHASNDEFSISQAIFNNLVRIDTQLKPQPELASDWQSPDAGKSWTFNLRKGVKFHHGREFTSKDVEFTIKRLLDKANASPGRSLFEMVSEIQLPDPHSIRFNLSFPYADFPMMFGAVYARIVPYDATTDISKSPIGTGPFRLKDFVPADRVTLIRNTDYWEKDAAGNQLPYVDEFRQVTIPEQAAQIAALSGGSVDLLMEPSIQSIFTLKTDANVKILDVPSLGYHELTMWVDRPPLQDNRVRQALKYTLDREQLVKIVLGGHGTPSNDNPVSPISPFWVDTGVRKRDIQKAKALMAEAGYRDGVDLELVASNERAGLVEFAVSIKEMSLPAGFRINVKTVPWDVYTAQYNRKHPFHLQPWNGRPTIDETLYPYYHSKGSYKELYNFSNKDVDQLLDEGRKETDFQKRKEIYGKVQRILVDNGPTIIPYHRPNIMAIHKRVQGFEIHPVRWVDLRRTWLT